MTLLLSEIDQLFPIPLREKTDLHTLEAFIIKVCKELKLDRAFVQNVWGGK